jgi:hypothetical protein
MRNSSKYMHVTVAGTLMLEIGAIVWSLSFLMA